MCNLKQEEFLNIRFKENEAERECWQELINTINERSLITASIVELLPQTFLKISKKKREIYQSHLDCEVVKQKTEFETDEILNQLRTIQTQRDNGTLTHTQYWMKIDTILFNTTNKRDYIMVNGEWVKNTND